MKIFRKPIHRSSLQLDVTPLADIVFLLLIFFMLSSTFVSQPGISIKLPKSRAREIRAEEQLMLTITKDNIIYVNKNRVSINDLEKELRLLIAARSEKVVIIRADAGVTHGLVVEALDAARNAGADKLAIATEKKRK